LLDANRRPISEAYGFAAEMQRKALRVVEGNKYFPKNWMVVKDLVWRGKLRDARTTGFGLYSRKL
jgi:hypothetical protein